MKDIINVVVLVLCIQFMFGCTAVKTYTSRRSSPYKTFNFKPYSLNKMSMSSITMSSNIYKASNSNIATSIQDIIHQYDYFIIDQWGVLHNGKVPYSGVLEALHLLQANNKILILLSNSSKRKSASFKGLQKVGIKEPLSYFSDIITSGEIGFHILKDKQFYNKENKNINKMINYFVIGNNDDDVDYLTQAQCCITSIDKADVVLVRGTFCVLSSSTASLSNDKDIIKKSYINPNELLHDIDSHLAECRKFNLPMIVTNPDFYRPGSNDPMP